MATPKKPKGREGARRTSNNPSGRPRKPEGEKYRALHVTLPPELLEFIRRHAAETHRTQGQVVIDALIHQHGDKIHG